MKSIKNRIRDLEINTKKGGYITAWQSLDDPDLYTVIEHDKLGSRGRYGELDKPQGIMTWEAIEKKYSDRDIIRVIYVNDWRG